MATIQELENRLNALEKAFLQSQKNQVPVTAKVDDTSNRVTSITPYTDTKTAYIGDTECVFDDVPQGNVSVHLNDVWRECVIARTTPNNRLFIYFDKPLEEVTTVSISIS